MRGRRWLVAIAWLQRPQVRALSWFVRPTLPSRDLDGVAEVLAGGAKCVVMLGAGASTSAGLPDFRSPGSGLYENLDQFDLPTPEAIFDIRYFRQNPEPFYVLARSLWPGRTAPTATHLFVKLLHEKGQLLRCYTQNIDSLETAAGLPAEAVVAAHGNFDSATCVDTGAKVDVAEVERALFSDDSPAAMRQLNEKHGGLVKSDIVFFGEELPERFFRCAYLDFPSAEVLMVVGTSLSVYPFASLIDLVTPATPRCLINRERVGEAVAAGSSFVASGFDFRHNATNPRDVFYAGDADDAALLLADKLGWRRDLDALLAATSVDATRMALR